MTTSQELDEAVLAERRHLLNLGYRMLGSVAEAEDATQAAFARWYALSDAQRARIESVRAWLTTVTTRICLDVLRSSRSRRELYVGDWLPEPLPGALEDSEDPAHLVTMDESVSMAFLVMLESLTPPERIALVLHDVYGYPFAQVARIMGRSAPACRQLASSARRRLKTSPALEPGTDEDAALVRAFLQAWERHDVPALLALLDPDATAVADGGGLARAARRPVEGAERVARYLVGLLATMPGFTMRSSTVNGEPGVVGERAGSELTVFAFQVSSGQVRRIWVVRSPEKLRLWMPTCQPN